MQSQSLTHHPLQQYFLVRQLTERLCESLLVEDYVIQTMPDVSPVKWHLAHTTWFYENFVLKPHCQNYKIFHPRYNFLFNSYYNSMGSRHCRSERGFLSRPTVSEVYQYRHYVDDAMEKFLADSHADIDNSLQYILDVGLNHEQQHQELMLTDIKHIFACNPLQPVYSTKVLNVDHDASGVVHDQTWFDYYGGLVDIGHEGTGFSYDNEGPRHKVYLNPFRVSSHLVTNQDYIDFINDGGYRREELWLSDGWHMVQQNDWKYPLYWDFIDKTFSYMTLNGYAPVRKNEPVSHISFYEADAYARWAGFRLLTEYEWETAAKELPIKGNFVDSECFHPLPVKFASHPIQMFGDLWEWTSSSYSAYPSYRPASGALGEYNGKFMSNQMVLRGGSCVSSQSHLRATYRNFFHPHVRWQFSGIRLGDNV